MVGLKPPPDEYKGMDEREQEMVVAPYADILWRSEIEFTLTESLTLPGVMIDTIHFIRQAQRDLKQEKNGTR